MIKYELDCPYLSFLKLASFFSTSKGTTLLLSGNAIDEQNSYLCLLPYKYISITQLNQNPWDTLKQKIADFNDDPTPKWVGYLSYEMSCYSDQDKRLPHKGLPIPLTHFNAPSIVVSYCKNKIRISAVEEAKNYLKHEELKWFNNFCSREFCLTFIQSLHDILGPCLEMSQHDESDTVESYSKKIQIAKELIFSGDIYQVNISRSSFFRTKAAAFDIFYKLHQINPVPFSAFINNSSFQIISASPERFLKHSDNQLESRPIKGTIQRGSNLYEDASLRSKLVNSSKEEAELMMICDLTRNDLGRISHTGSVRCTEPKNVLELSNVFHLESTVVSTPSAKHPIDMIRSCFPAGSISGCPKLRALEIIHQIEKRTRHIYCGSIGYISSNGNFDFNVAIRTALLKDEILEVQLGGAITADSSCKAEYDETLYKGNPFLKVFENKDSDLNSLCLKNQPKVHYAI
ncbi:MAG: Isochorismate synthase MenF [Chlamydiae bacterium]|nr:Isochorismate synthase MenF [Chlamydiota bacterium]